MAHSVEQVSLPARTQLGLLLNTLFGWWWADSLAALALVYFIIQEGREALHEARTGETCSCCMEE